MSEDSSSEKTYLSFDELYDDAVKQGLLYEPKNKAAELLHKCWLEPCFNTWLQENKTHHNLKEVQAQLTLNNLSEYLDFEQEQQRKKDILGVWFYDSVFNEVAITSASAIEHNFEKSKNYGKLFFEIIRLAEQQFNDISNALDNYSLYFEKMIRDSEKTSSIEALSFFKSKLNFRKVWLLEKSNKLDSLEKIHLEKITQGADYNVVLSTVVILYKNGSVGLLEPVVELEKLLRERLEKDLLLVEGYIRLLDDRIKEQNLFTTVDEYPTPQLQIDVFENNKRESFLQLLEDKGILKNGVIAGHYSKQYISGIIHRFQEEEDYFKDGCNWSHLSTSLFELIGIANPEKRVNKIKTSPDFKAGYDLSKSWFPKIAIQKK